ncbi:uncharacterized protein CC84DRAFT_456079 [Paraphaeosphaeria sporulosa]|uniref:Uncharacterized protein n=1 Tax=Paraphaeosphaeria sporulosa TaxID=1460663 RepID=A0A177CT35_9PLEO|nr:uncharacterized protein CC84DRAFT_456079 [Paraphaeosphaeria sporulosa]OAG09909.1 hypothetical protein CC84DRAFT_456079 [Paraphaeosphaeria sporulosa]
MREIGMYSVTNAHNATARHAIQRFSVHGSPYARVRAHAYPSLNQGTEILDVIAGFIRGHDEEAFSLPYCERDHVSMIAVPHERRIGIHFHLFQRHSDSVRCPRPLERRELAIVEDVRLQALSLVSYLTYTKVARPTCTPFATTTISPAHSLISFKTTLFSSSLTYATSAFKCTSTPWAGVDYGDLEGRHGVGVGLVDERGGCARNLAVGGHYVLLS